MLLPPVVLASREEAPTEVLFAPVEFTNNAFTPTAVLLLAVLLVAKAPLPTAVFKVPVLFDCKAFCPTAVLLEAVVLVLKAPEPTAVFDDPEVQAVKEFLPIAVLFPPETEASKAVSPKTVLPATEFAPLPIITEFIVASLLVTVNPLPSNIYYFCRVRNKSYITRTSSVNTSVSICGERDGWRTS